MLSAFGSSDGPSDVNADGIVNVLDRTDPCGVHVLRAGTMVFKR